jgi:hypothetical protein
MCFVTEVFEAGHWEMDCQPKDFSGFDRLLASDPTRLHPFLATWHSYQVGQLWVRYIEIVIPYVYKNQYQN